MENKEKIIDLRQFVLYLWEKIILVLLIVFCFIAVFTGYSFKKQKAAINGTATSINTIINTNRNAYFEVDNAKFTDAVIPAGVYNSYARVYVDYESDLIDEASLDSDMMERIAHDITMLARSSDSMTEIIEELDLRSYPDMSNISENDLSYMINANMMGIHIVNIVVSDVDPERGTCIAEAVLDKFQEKAIEYSDIKEVKILDKPSETILTESVTGVINKRKLAKYAIVGGVLGAFFAVLLLLVDFVIRDRVRTEIDLEYADTNIYGKIPVNNTEESIKKVAYSLLMEEDVNNLLITPVDSKTNVDGILSVISNVTKEEKKKLVVKGSDSIMKSSDAMIMLKDADSVLLVATFGITREKDLIDAVMELKRTNKRILGVLLSNTKY